MEASVTRAERAKRRRQSAIEQQEQEVAEKRRALHDTGKPVSEINFVDEELSRQEDVHEEATDNLCQDFEAGCYVQTTMDTESGQDAETGCFADESFRKCLWSVRKRVEVNTQTL